MRILASGKREGSVKIGRKLIDLLTSSNELLINLLLELKTSRVNRELLKNLRLQVLTRRSIESKETSSTLAKLGSLGLLEGSISDVLNINVRDINLGGSGDNISSSDTTKRNTVELIRARDKKKAALKTLQEDSTAASKTTSNDDNNSAGSKRLAESRELNLLLLSALALALAATLLPVKNDALHTHVGNTSVLLNKKKYTTAN